MAHHFGLAVTILYCIFFSPKSDYSTYVIFKNWNFWQLLRYDKVHDLYLYDGKSRLTAFAIQSKIYYFRSGICDLLAFLVIFSPLAVFSSDNEETAVSNHFNALPLFYWLFDIHISKLFWVFSVEPKLTDTENIPVWLVLFWTT